ncbi:hypothetical protein K8353_01390 [Burkholderia contaminans]|nr:hypothetical protein [Burkholderia contaminans]
MSTQQPIRLLDNTLSPFYEANPEFNLLTFDFHNQASHLRSRLADAGVPEAELDGKIENFKALHRLAKLSVDETISNGLMSRGIRSANQLARIPEVDFTEQFASSLGLTAEDARALHRRAQSVRNKSMHIWASVRGTTGSPYFRGTPLDTVDESFNQTFQNLPSYQDLFGSLDYCDCPECRSIFGPAAYLVDLLRIIDEYVTKPNTGTIDPAFLFTKRRADIGGIPLTCDKTNTSVPYLQIVNERLLDYARQTLGLESSDRVLEQLATTLVYPQALPFNARLDQIRVLLDKLGISVGALLSAWKVDPNTVGVRSLGLSPEQQHIVTTALDKAADIAPYFQVTPPDQLLTILSDAGTFMDKTWMGYADLLDLLNQDLSADEQTAGLQVNFFVNAGLSGTWLSLTEDKNKPPVLNHLGLAQLDQINRLLRLSNVTGQPVRDLDWALRCVQAGGAPVIDTAALGTLQRLLAASATLDIELMDACVLLGPIKTYGQVADGAGSPFDQRFNSTALLSNNTKYHPSGNPLNPGYKDTPLAWTPGSANASDVAAINRVLPGLKISLSDANLLGLSLYGASAQQLTVQTISTLYRHALLMRAFSLPASRYLILLKLAASFDAKAPTMSEIDALIDLQQWLTDTGLSVYDLDYIVNGTASVYVDPRYVPGTVDDWLRSLWATVPVSSPDTHADIKAQVAVLFGLDSTPTDTMMTMALAAVPLPAGVSDWGMAFLTPAGDQHTPQYGPYVQAVLQWVSRWAVMTQALGLSDAALANVAACPAAYQLGATFDAVPPSAVIWIQRVQQMMLRHGDQQQNLLSYIALATGDGMPSSDALAALQKATNWAPDAVAVLLTAPIGPTLVRASQLSDLQACFDWMDKLGADPAFMASIVALANLPAAGNWATYTQTATAVTAKVASLYGVQWDAIWSLLAGNIAARLRDALLALVLSQLHAIDPTIKTARNVYEFLLTDVEMGPATTISYIKEALNAAQLYLQRCRLRLEPGVTDLSRIHDTWWEWIMNYRVWEANRQIFVYPENYLVPTLRRNTTPQFDTLSQALQQSQVTQAYVESAFSTYINGFADVSQLKPVDAYRTSIDGTDTLYLLSRSKTGPYTFYYCRQQEGMPWSAWEKIDLSINSPNGTLVFAFNRPFLFWNEIKKNNTSAVSGNAGTVTTNNSSTYTASVMYSFLNHQGEWVQPQTLVDQDVVLFLSDDNRKIDLKDLNIFDGAFDLDAPSWNKVFAFSVNASNYQPAPPYPAESERLVVMFGPNLVDTGSMVDAGTTPPTTDPNATSFWHNLHRRAEDHNRMVTAALSGNVDLQPIQVLNFSLDDSVLVRHEELILTDSCRPKMPLSSIYAQLQSAGDVLQITYSGQPVTDNRNARGSRGLSSTSSATTLDGKAFITTSVSATLSLAIYEALVSAGAINESGNVVPSAMATLDLYAVLSSLTVYNQFGPQQYASVLRTLFSHMSATELFSSVGGNPVQVIPVGCQPGWFMFSVSDEVFLLSPQPAEGTPNLPPFSTFSTGLRIGAPRVERSFAIMQYQDTDGQKTIDADVSNQILDVLKNYGLVTDGQVSAYATLSNVKLALAALLPPASNTLASNQVPYIYRALNNFAIVYNDAFIGGNIDANKSQAIYNTLQTFSLIDPNGRVDEDNLNGQNVTFALATLLYNNTISQSDLPGIYRSLVQAPKTVAVDYVNAGTAASFTSTDQFKFDVTRLSTGAIDKINRALFVNGVDGLLALRTQQIPVQPVLPIERFSPSPTHLAWPNALDATQVDFDGLYGQYFWEIFYFIPMLVANGLTINQQFQQAQRWLQYVFNPTLPEQFVTADAIVAETSGAIARPSAVTIVAQLKNHTIGNPAAAILNANGEVNPAFAATTDLSFLKQSDKTLTDLQILMVRNILLNFQLSAPASHFWQFRPFRTHTLESLQDMLSDTNPAIQVYNDDPFDPFAIARLRIGAFEKSTLMAYVDNLIAWGDQLFTQYTWESNTAAYMLYVYAFDLLGPKPQQVGSCAGDGVVLTFDEIKAKYPNGIPQFLIDLEHFVPSGSAAGQQLLGHAFNDLFAYFCVPENSQLTARWDTVIDRMTKINNSLTIDGVYRALPLFEPPLNPLDLVKAAAAGNNVLPGAASASQSPPPYRFSSALNSAQGLCSVLIELGNALLSTLEKGDAEALSALRTRQEGQILQMMLQIKQDRIDELQATIRSLTITENAAKNRLQFYTDLIDTGLIDYEETSLSAMESALAFNILGSISKTAATIAYAVPQVGSPFAMTYGGVQLGSAVNAASGVFEIGAEISTYIAQRASTMGGYARRTQEWTLQQQSAQSDVDNIGEQLVAANSQLQSAQQDLAAQNTSIAQNQAVDAYLDGKFTNQQLYQWMTGRLSAFYFQTYALAVGLARDAQTAYQFETDTDRTFLSFDYWDSLHKGLTAGEGLRLALNRMDASYRSGDTRRLEIERTVSLAMIAPDQLLALKTSGECTFSLSEALFDYDYPGHYARKIKTISLSIPALVGPYQNIKATLTQTKNSVVTAPDIDVVKYLLTGSGDIPQSGLRQNWSLNQRIAVSHGLDNTGLFQLDFQDPRYLPFENTGAVSEWSLSMPLTTNRFDFEQLSDVIISVRYTALYDGQLATKVKQALAQNPLAGGVYADAGMQGAAWLDFLANHDDKATQTLTLNVNPAQVGYFKSLTYTQIVLQLTVASGVSLASNATFLTLTAGAEPPQSPAFTDGRAVIDNPGWDGKTLAPSWNFRFALDNPQLAPLLKDGFIDGDKLLNLQVVALYDAKVF